MQMYDYAGIAGVEYAERNPQTPDEMDALYLKRCGRTRTDLNASMLNTVPKDARILEVGASIGIQLELLDEAGYHDLWACDINPTVLEQCPYPSKVGDILDLPYEDQSFDLVFTSGTLMHVPPENRETAINELARISRQWIFGYETWDVDRIKETWSTLPPAWTEDWPGFLSSWLSPKWRLSEVLIMHGQPHHCMYLVERENHVRRNRI